MMPFARPYAYIRKSTMRNADDKREDQTEYVRSLAGECGDDPARLVILDQDWGISAAREKVAQRKAMVALLTALEAGEVSALYVKSLDRIARDVESAARILNACERARVPIRVAIPRQDYDASNGVHRQLFHMLAMQAEAANDLDKGKAAARVIRQRERGIAMGQKHYGELPGEDAGAVVAAFTEAGSYNGASRLLIARGIPSRHPKNGVSGWTATTVKRTVARQVALGNAPGTVLPIAARRGARSIATHRLSRLLVCPHDGSLYSTIPHANDPGRAVSYTCRIAAKGPFGDHPRPYVVSETAILPAVQAAVGNIARVTFARVDADGIVGSIAELQAKRERVIESYVDGLIGKPTRDERLTAIQAELDGLEASKRATFRLHNAIDWSADPGTINARLRELWTGVRLAYADPLPVQKPGRYNAPEPPHGRRNAQRIVAVGAYWRVPPEGNGEPIGERQEDGTWYVPFEDGPDDD